MNARFRLGSETKANKYWLKAEEKLYRIYGKQEETLQHVFETCEHTGKINVDWKQQMTGKEALAIMWNIIWTRKRKEKEKDKT